MSCRKGEIVNVEVDKLFAEIGRLYVQTIVLQEQLAKARADQMASTKPAQENGISA
jgi:hypothetical protein